MVRASLDLANREGTTVLGQCVIVDAYTHRNAGDAAIVLSTAELLKDRGAAGVAVATRHFAGERDFYRDYGIEVVQPAIPFPVRGQMSHASRGLTFLLHAIVAFLLAILFRFAPGGTLAVARTIGPQGFVSLALADTVVLCGGGYLYSSPARINLNVVHCALSRTMARLLGKPTLMMPQSIGPLSRRSDRFFVRAALRDVDPVVVRERESLREARRLFGTRQPVVVCPDIALLGWSPPSGFEKRAQDGGACSRLGVIAMDWTWARQVGRDRLEVYEQKLACLARRLDQQGFHVEFLASSRLPAEAQDDSAVAASIVRRARTLGAGSVEVSEGACGVEELRAALAQEALVVSTRMHGALIAMTQGTPAIALGYQPKTLATYDLLGLSDLCHDVDSFDVEEVAGLVQRVLMHREAYRERVATAMARARSWIVATFQEPPL